MDKVLFHMFSDDRFMDLTLYQYGYEQCLPLHSYGPFVRNHFLFHYVISGKGTLLVDDENSQSTEYQLQGGMGFLIANIACRKLVTGWASTILSTKFLMPSEKLQGNRILFLPDSKTKMYMCFVSRAISSV